MLSRIRPIAVTAALLLAIAVVYLTVGITLTLLTDDAMIATLVLTGIVTVIVIAVRRLRPRWLSYPDLEITGGPRPSRAPNLQVCVALAALMSFVTGQGMARIVYDTIGSEGFDRFAEVQLTTNVVVLLLLVLLAAPVGEEMLLRGLVYPVLRLRTGLVASMVVSSLIFGIMHGNLVQLVATTPFALVLAALYERTRAVLPCIGLHLLYNLTAIVVPDTVVDQMATPWVVVPALAGLGIGLWLTLHARNPAQDVPEESQEKSPAAGLT